MAEPGPPAVGEPPSSANDPLAWQHSELLGPRSLFGAIALLAAAALFFLLPPFIDGNTEYATAGPDGRYALDDFASIQVAEGWGIESQSELFTTIAKGGMTSVLTPSIESDSTAAEYAQVLVDGLEGAGTWQIDPIREFTTDAGVPGSSYLAYGTDDVAGTWVVVDEGRLVVFSGTASESAFKEGLDDLDQMARSILIESIPGAGE